MRIKKKLFPKERMTERERKKMIFSKKKNIEFPFLVIN